MINRPLLTIFILSIFLSACVNNGTATLSATTLTPMSLRVTLPAYPNRRFSAYVFGNNNLVGVVRSNAVTDSSGSLTVNVMAVDANNCATATQAKGAPNVVYNFHYRIDSNANSSFIYPSNCPSDAGFLSSAGQGYAEIRPVTYYSFWPYYIGYVYNTSASTFNFSNTGLGTVVRQSYCSVVDGQILDPTIFISSTLGYAQGATSFTSGSGSATTTMTFASGPTTAYKYACWIDANNSGTYNSGDLIANGPGNSGAVSNWTTVP